MSDRPGLPTADKDSGSDVIVGAVAIAAGIAAIVLVQALKPDAEALLQGGFVLKEGYRTALTAGGVVSLVFGVLLVLLAGLNPGAAATFRLASLTTLVAVALCLGGVLLAVGYAVDRGDESQSRTPTLDSTVQGQGTAGSADSEITAEASESEPSGSPGVSEVLDLSELNTPEIQECMEKANNPKKPLRERTRAILACTGSKSEQVRKAALESCLSYADVSPEPQKARKLCHENLSE